MHKSLLLLTKIEISKFLVLLGFILNLASYSTQLFDFYRGDTSTIAFAIDDTEEKSESKENEASEKEDSKEKNKISQSYEGKTRELSIDPFKFNTEFYIHTFSVFLEQNTPPPKYS